MKVSRTIEYAVYAIVEVARAGAHPVSSSKIAAHGGLPERFLLQILREMTRHGLLLSVRGAAGGYCLGERSDQISLLDVMEVFGNPPQPDLQNWREFPSDVQHRILSTLEAAADAARRELRKLTIADLR